MEMHEIRYFLAASRTLNFHRAADQMNVTQPALTRAIKKLERELGGLLFLREHNRVRLTEFGSLMCRQLGEVIERSENAKETARSFLKLEATSLVLGVMCTIGPVRFVRFLSAFHDRHPDVGVTVIEGVPARLTGLLLDGKLDAALMAQPQPFDGRLKAEPIYNERFGLAFPADHPFEERSALHFSDVDGQPYLDRINCEYGDYIEGICKQRGIAIRSVYRSDREDWIMAMIAAGMGVCFAPEFSIGMAGVRHRILVDPPLLREICLVTLPELQGAGPVARFAEAVRTFDWAGT